MKTIILLLAASLALALTPTASAATCLEEPPREGIDHPLADGKYLFIVGSDGTFDPDLFGEWSENNRQDGLQVRQCMAYGLLWYRADVHSAVLP